MTKVLAVISFIDQHGNPIDPGFGGGRPAPGDPDFGIPEAPHRPDNALPSLPVGTWPPRFPPDPIDPEWGQGHPRPPRPSLPIFIPSVGIDNELPPVAGTKPPANPPPGTIWPPLPPGLPEGKGALLVWLIGVGWRYMVVDIPPTPAPK